MSYRFLKITTVYPEYERQFLAENADCSDLDYDELFGRFAKTLYAWSDFFTKHMRILGNEAQDIFASLEPLQKSWARENGVAYREDSWFHDIVIAQVRMFQPDVLFLQDLYKFGPSFREVIRATCGKPILLVGWRAAPTDHFDEFKDLDLVLTAFPHFVERLRTIGVNAHLMLHAFEQAVHATVSPIANPDLDFTFAGSLGGRDSAFSDRHELIAQLMESTPLEVWGTRQSAPVHSVKDWLLFKSIYTSNRLLSAVGISESTRGAVPLVRNGIRWKSDPTAPVLSTMYPGRFHEAVFGVKYFELLAHSKVTLNIHINAAESAASNIRLYEATGMGACLLTDWKPNLHEIFEPDIEVVTYRSPVECAEKLGYLLEHENERKAIAAAGQRRTLSDHTLGQRVTELDELIRSLLSASAV